MQTLAKLGRPVGPMARISGGYANRLYRLDTDQGSYAVKEMNLLDRHEAYRFDDVFRFERAAFAAGIPMPEPVAASAGLIVHRWVDGEKVPEEPVSEAYAYEIGGILARLHALDVTWPGFSSEEQPAYDWPELADRATATGQPWAADLSAQVGTFLAIARFIDGCERPGPIVLTHRDVQPWNLLSQAGRPILLDWELFGRLDLSAELGSTALSIAKGRGYDTIDPAVFHSVLNGYAAAGGSLPPWGPSWFVHLIGGWLGHTRWNIQRCLAPTDPATGPERALSHDSVRDGIRGLPDLFSRLPALQDLLAY